MEPFSIKHPTKTIQPARIPLPSSKSESNRALIIQALGGQGISLDNLSSARDTQTMIRLLRSADATLNVLDAGTTMRFLTAYCTAQQRPTILTGTHRMLERPIGILVDALRKLGGEIEYMGEEGYPPIGIRSFVQKTAAIAIRGDVSSQYISALLLIAPTLASGLTLELTGDIGSRPYIEMTLRLMGHFGVAHTWEGNVIHIAPQAYKQGHYSIESDWSGASYWYSAMALAERGELFLEGLRERSWQGDRAIIQIMKQLGVLSYFENGGIRLKKDTAVQKFNYDFTDCPDLAQTVAVICAAKRIPANLTGLQSLRIKETDRIAALQAELEKFGTKTVAIGDETLRIYPDEFVVDGQCVNTYKDHRMAMAFAPIAMLGSIEIEQPSVVDKSYPSFWEDMARVGFECSALV